MMDDHIAPERIVDWVDGRLSGDEEERVRLHVESCPACGRAAEDLARLDERVRNAAPPGALFPDEPIPASLDKALDDTAKALLSRPGRRGLFPGGAPPAQEDRRSRVLAGTIVALAAGIILAFALFFFHESGGITWELVPRQTGQDVFRGDKVAQYYIDVTLPAGGWFYILDLDRAGDFSWIYPFVTGSGSNDFGVTGPFREGERVRIPPSEPDGFEGFELAGDCLFLVPAERPLSDGELRGIVSALENALAGKPQDPAARAPFIRDWLSARYGGTRVMRVSDR